MELEKQTIPSGVTGWSVHRVWSRCRCRTTRPDPVVRIDRADRNGRGDASRHGELVGEPVVSGGRDDNDPGRRGGVDRGRGARLVGVAVAVVQRVVERAAQAQVDTEIPKLALLVIA